MGSVQHNSLTSDVLERTHILEEILERVDEYAGIFDKVDYSALKDEVLKPVLAEDFDPETQIRGFLRTFRHTLAYKAAFSKIAYPSLRVQINEFIDGKQSKEVVGGKEFHLIPHKSPPVVHHLSVLGELKKLLLDGLEVKKAVKNVLHPKHKHVKILPVLYESSTSGQVVEVSHHFLRVFHS
jgi:hypothetical protein